MSELQQVTKCVWQFHDKKDELTELFDYFRYCTNEAIRIADEKNLTSRNTMIRICDIEECGGKHFGKGYCKKHYQRLRQHSSTDFPNRKIRLCSVDECENKHNAKGLCHKHYMLEYRYSPQSIEYQKEYGKNNKVKTKIRNKKYRIENPEKIKMIGKQYRAENKNKLNEQSREYHVENKKILNKKAREKYHDDPEKHNKRNNLYRKNYPDKVLESEKKYIEKIAIPLKFPSIKLRYALQAWSLTVRKLGDWVCKICNAPATVSHHIFHKSMYPKLALNINNGIPLCDTCHVESHGWNFDSQKVQVEAVKQFKDAESIAISQEKRQLVCVPIT